MVGISGASSPQLGISLLEALRKLDTVETHLIISEGARRTIPLEAQREVEEVEEMADVVYGPGDLSASVASGSFLTVGMAVAPCSMRTLAAIATGNTGDLLTRVADVCLKERRKLVLLARESPLNLIHLRNMTAVTEAGAVVMPPVLAFYHRPQSVEELLRQITGKVLDQFGIEHTLFTRWS